MLQVVLFKFNQNSSIHQKIIMKKANKVLDIEASPLSESMKPRLDTLWSKRKEANSFTIFRTPHNISKSKKKLFEPSVISIGPFHHGRKHLRAMEDQKWRFLHDFLSHGSISLDLCISEMKKLEEKTRRCYCETVDLGSNAFVQMMLLDGCFVLEYFINIYKENWNSIIEVGWNHNFVVCDLLRLENQIPFFIVQKLFEIGLKEKVTNNFSLNPEVRNNLVDCFVHIVARCLTFDSRVIHADRPPAKIHHLVHLCYHSLVPQPDVFPISFDLTRLFSLVPHPEEPDVFPISFDLTRLFSANRTNEGLLHWFRSWPVCRRRSAHSGNISSMMIPSATHLKQKGLKFKPNINPKHMLDISFKHGVLKIPNLAISDDTKPIFANFIAFEHTKYGKRASPFTSFVAFLDNLVNTPNDVTILQECEIIENWLGSEEEVAHFINQVTEGNAIGSDHYLADLYKEVNQYSKKSWNRHREKLISDYFSNPWAIISLVAALILLFLTIVQAFFAVFSYFRPT